MSFEFQEDPPMTKRALAAAVLAAAFASPALAQSVLVEAENFKDPGGWSLDTQFIEIVGSPYLLAHGLGTPVKDAETTVAFPSPGTWKVFVRTKDWVARWNAPGTPGRFQLLVDGKALPVEFGTKGKDWAWQEGGSVEIAGKEAKLALHDLTGFDGRCDAIFFSKGGATRPPADAKPLAPWRKELLGLPAKPDEEGPFDLVVVGGGYAGTAAAVSAARLGCKVALIQDRGVLGGNGSSEVRVWSKGIIKTGLFPALGEIVEEFMDKASSSPGKAEEFGDAKKEALVRAEKNLSLFLNHYAYQVEKQGSRIASVTAFDVRTGRERRFEAKYFVDCTGHASIGMLAGAHHTTQEKGHMGMSNMWRWAETDSPQAFPETPWALPLEMGDFPYPNKGKGEWFWETGFDRDPLEDLEYARDYNLRAVFGAFNAMKNRGGKEKHAHARLEWVAHVGGTRESRQLLGDVVLTQDDIVQKKAFPDGCVPTTWDIDLHYPEKKYAAKFPEDPFISRAAFGKGVDKKQGYPVPYRCFYSRNVPNLFMAGRHISVTHEALGTVRVQRTTGMMGEVVGKAAAICAARKCMPQAVYTDHLEELKELMRLPGATRRDVAHGQAATEK
jgi:hypothetical protein